ncbi:thiamine-monophosphate kinase [Neomicrococcus aestuarii]|uniref:Thiamine-monophosphate kinase n=1 Tax=Neomicrococcus aestuarii TaxID=556325 RepID=A0A7W8WZ11_9MICC|nr:thiamine-phosphate kinase [Neomicrococcus aestuarii]MBB5511353.1 thiamine-monophosphate kinase [Neomicrococcus aestuarii]
MTAASSDSSVPSEYDDAARFPLDSSGEERLIGRLLSRYRSAPALLGPGDDAAMIAAPDGRFVISVDTLVEDQDFRVEWPSGVRTSGYDVGWKSAAQNLSDINAMGAIATAAVISLSLPRDTPLEWVEGVALGFSAALEQLGAGRCSIAGGDVGRSGEISITAAVTGHLSGAEPRVRSGARPHHVIAVCGHLGAAGAGLALLDQPAASGVSERPWSSDEQRCVDLQLRPEPPLREGPVAVARRASSMMDISDGLLRDAGRIARASGVVMAIDSSALTFDLDMLRDAGERLETNPLNWTLTGGEGHALLATYASLEDVPSGWHAIGEVRAGQPQVLVDNQEPSALGFDHFSGV